MPPDPSLVGRTGALHGVDSPLSSHAPSFHQQPLEPQQRRASQSLQGLGRSSSAPPALQQRGRPRTRSPGRAHPPASPATDLPPSAHAQPPAAPNAEHTLLNDMEARQRQLMTQQFELQMGVEERQATMLQVKTAADMTKLMNDTVSEVTKGFLESARKVMQEGGEAMKLR
ncbi:type III effector [Pseudomonas sp. S75]|uniref:type III effector n=1 Tax=unclassified Pseudomonas TaxID=196821 RepID=UPI00190472A0|nr:MULTISPECIES: type III effector [unclassified Pseudomonas]MBJ9977908.1 type III effector [Pseudomonas sp. S30]MBK0155886.1 type III effector [Pseudomonas sp. S75]